ncbi:MAG: 4Fe-4S binding protein [Deltaproteobacteria bacterium]|nr:4Fe-4S binding protein [Deltaproteobacteria bacterium]MBW2071254.1 4Fe-4S binding protein [Deltaproteobacteria bacterium]
MAAVSIIEVQEGNPVISLRQFFKELLRLDEVIGLLAAQHLPMKNVVMPTLITDPEKLAGVDPLAPAFPLNAAKVVAKLTRKPLGGKILAVLRPCEIRAFIELVKLKQGMVTDVVLLGVDCLGAYSNIHYPQFAGGDGPESTLRFYRNIWNNKGTACNDFDLSAACKACEHPVADNADILIGLLGMNIEEQLLVQGNTEKGAALLAQTGMPAGREPAEREEAVTALLQSRCNYRDQMYAATSEATADLAKLTSYLANCVNCYNCRVACPVCYCKECVFVTDVFDHEPWQYLRWASRKGVLKLPTDTVFYHLTRLAHMSTACIGCGQCSNACPNNIPVMELFRTIASYTQAAFDCVAGRSVDEQPPLSVFREHEFPEVTGGKE